jgi:hypothetical protein
MKTKEVRKLASSFGCQMSVDRQERRHGSSVFGGSAENRDGDIILDSKRATANSPYDGITREVVEIKGTAVSRFRKTGPNRSIAKPQTKSRLILIPDSLILAPLIQK